MKFTYLLVRCAFSSAAMLAFCLAAPFASAAPVSWAGADVSTLVSTNWSDTNNWIGGILPGIGDTVIFGNDDTSTNSIANAATYGPANAANASGGQPSDLVSSGGTADNIVDRNFTLAALLFEQTNAAGYSELNQIWHNTVINSNVTLTLSNTDISIMLESGTLSDPSDGLTYCYSTISGPGTLDVNNTNAGSAICVQQGSGTYAGDQGQWAILDMSGLSNFDATVGRLMVGVQGIGANSSGQVNLFNDNRSTGWLYLAATNVITLTQSGVIETNGNPGAFAAAAGPALVLCDTYGNFSDFQCFLILGQNNTINADTITIGRNQTYHTAHFGFNIATYPNSPSLILGGYSSPRVSEFIVADTTAWPGNGGCCVVTGTSPNEMVQPAYDTTVDIGGAGLVDLSEGTSDMMIDTLIVGKGWDGVGINNVNFGPSGKVLGVFNMGAGTLDVNTLELGVQFSLSATTPVTGTLNVNAGSVLVHSNQLYLGLSLGGDAIATANLNITNGGSLTVDNGFGIVDSGQSLSEVTLDNATVTAANIGSSSAPIGSMTIGDSTLNLAVNGVTGSVVANSLTTESISSGITINITSIGQVPGLEQVITLISSGTPIASIGTYSAGVNGFNLGPLPNGYTGHLEVTASAVQLVLTHSLSVPNSWTGTDISSHNTNWSDINNWSAAVEPSLSNPAYFLTSGSVASSALSLPGGGPSALVSANVNNIVDGNVTTIGLTYANTNGTYQNTYIANNDTLTASTSGLGMTVGSPLQDFGNTTGHVTISGPGTLTVNSGFYVGLGDTNSGSVAETTLDMSALNTFTSSVPTFLVGVGLTVPQAAGVVYLAKTNTITATSSQADDSDSSPVALEVGDSSTLAGSVRSALYLGETNAIDASAISVGRQLASGSILFNPAVTNSNPTASSGPWAYFSGAGGATSPVGTWTIGDGVANSGSPDPVAGSGTNDFTGGYVNALVNTFTVAANSSSSSISHVSAVTGTLTFDAGNITANTLNVSVNNTNSGGDVYNYGVGTVNVNGNGTLIVNNTLNLAYAAGAPATAEVIPTATLNIDGGLVLANSIVAGTNGAVSVITINGGLLTCSNAVCSPAAPLTTLELTNSTIEIALSSSSAPFISAGNVNAGGTNTITLLSLPQIIENYPATITVLKSATAIKGTINNFKVVIPAQYSGSAAPSGDSTAILLTLTSGPVGNRGNVFWTGADVPVSTNWSDANNWSLSLFGLPGFPGPGDTALFDATGVSAAPIANGGSADNIVDRNFAVAAVQYSQTNTAAFSALNQIWHNTVINPNATLTLANTNVSIMLESGTLNDPSPPLLGAGYTYCYNSISGSGALVVNDTNVGSAISVSQGSSTYTGAPGLYATLDMSGLNTFDATVGRLMVAVQGVGPTPGQVSLSSSWRQAGNLSLAATNIITLTQAGNSQGDLSAAAVAGPALVVADMANFGDNPSSLNLGQSNAIYADTITIGRNGALQSAVLQFNTVLFPSGPSLYLRGYSSNRVSEFVAADSTLNGNSSKYETPDSRIALTYAITNDFTDGDSAVVDLSAGAADIMIDTLILGKGYMEAGGGYVVALFNMGTGTLNVNTLLMGVLSAAAGNKPVTGILNVPSGGTVIVNTQLALGQGFGGATSTLGAGDLIINGGTVSASTIVTDGNTNSTISVAGSGTLSLTSVAGSIGTVAAPVGSLTIDNSTLNLAIGGTGPTVVCSNLVTDITAGTSNTINITELPVIPSLPATLTLIQSGNPAVGTFNFVLGTKPEGYTCSLVNSFVNDNAVQLNVTGVPSPANGKGTSITSVSFQAATSSLVITGTNGLANDVYYILTSTNLALPVVSWTPIATNTFDANGDFNVSLPYSAGSVQQYYSIKSQ